MLSNLFSSFDLFYYGLWFSLLLSLMVTLFVMSYWKGSYRTRTYNILLLKLGIAFEQINYLVTPKMFKTAFISSFSTALLCNILSLFPYVFGFSSQVVTFMPLVVTIWTSIFIMHLFSYTASWLGHTLPAGSPLMLSPFLMIIEIVSITIRPFTASVRLIANVIAGHIILTLASDLFESFAGPGTLVVGVIIALAEIFVSVIQAYILSTMVSLFISDMR